MDKAGWLARGGFFWNHAASSTSSNSAILLSEQISIAAVTAGRGRMPSGGGGRQ